jgi:hypothetical protein
MELLKQLGKGVFTHSKVTVCNPAMAMAWYTIKRRARWLDMLCGYN